MREGLYGCGTGIDKTHSKRKGEEKVMISWSLTEFDLSSFPESGVAKGSCPELRHRVSKVSVAAEQGVGWEPLASTALVPQDTVQTL